MRFAWVLWSSLAIFGCGNVVVDGGAGSTSTTGTLTGAGGSATGCGGPVPVSHRPGGKCPDNRGPGTTFSGTIPPCTVGSGCQSDADCTDGPNGRCGSRGFGAICSQCTYDDCATDDDCPSGTPCSCRASDTDTPPNVCASGSQCSVDADCGGCGYCSPSVVVGSVCSAHEVAYFCHTPGDACTNDTDCTKTNDQCNFDAMLGEWSCASHCTQPP